jgi:hypothetical protein
MRWSRSYLFVALALLGVELLIARAPTGSLVRSYLGDTLAVALLYALMRAVRPATGVRAALYAFGAGCAVELGQAFDLVDRLGLGEVALARIAIGTHFDPLDLLAYAAALPLIVLAEHRAFMSSYADLCRGIGTKSRHPARPPGTLP